MAGVFSTFAIKDKHYVLGRPINGYLSWLSRNRAMGLQNLMAFNGRAPKEEEEDDHAVARHVYAESWFFVHYLIFGHNDTPAKALANYLRLSRSAATSADAFRSAFGMGYAEMDKKAGDYLRGKYRLREAPLLPSPTLVAEPATAPEVEDALGRLCLAADRKNDALVHAKKSLELSDNGPHARELLGQVLLELGQRPEALAAFAVSMERGSKDFRPYYETALARLESLTGPAGSPGGLDARAARGIANTLEQALNLHPRFLPAYERLAVVVEYVPAGKNSDRGFLEIGKELFPDSGLIPLGLAVISKREGDLATALSLLGSVFDLSATKPQPSEVLRYAERLRAAWAQPGSLPEPVR